MKKNKHLISMGGKEYEVIVSYDYILIPSVMFEYYEILPKRKFLFITKRYKGSKEVFPNSIMSCSIKSLAESGLKNLLMCEQYDAKLDEKMRTWE